MGQDTLPGQWVVGGCVVVQGRVAVTIGGGATTGTTGRAARGTIGTTGRAARGTMGTTGRISRGTTGSTRRAGRGTTGSTRRAGRGTIGTTRRAGTGTRGTIGRAGTGTRGTRGTIGTDARGTRGRIGSTMGTTRGRIGSTTGGTIGTGGRICFRFNNLRFGTTSIRGGIHTTYNGGTSRVGSLGVCIGTRSCTTCCIMGNARSNGVSLWFGSVCACCWGRQSICPLPVLFTFYHQVYRNETVSVFLLL